MSKWNKTTLAEIADIRVSNVDKKSHFGEKPVKLCNYMDVYSNNYITNDIHFMEATANIMEVAKFTISKGDVLITKDSETPFDIGIPSVVLEDIDNLVCGYHLAQLRPNEKKVNSIFLAKKLASIDISSYFSRRAAGSTRYGLSNGTIANATIYLPPLNIQNKIADILFVIDSTIDETEFLIDKYYKIKSGLMNDLFARGMDENGKLRPSYEDQPELYKDSEIGMIPKAWSIYCLGDILKKYGGYLQTGPFGSQLHSYEYTDEGIPVVMPQDINDGLICSTSISKISEKRALTLSKHRLKIDDVIISRRGDLSRSASISEPELGWVCGTGCFLLRLQGSKLDASFFSLIYGHHIVQRQVGGLCVGSTMPSLNNEIMKKITLPMMDVNEQKNIVHSISLLNKKIRMLKLEKNKLIGKRYGITNDLLEGKVLVNNKKSH